MKATSEALRSLRQAPAPADGVEAEIAALRDMRGLLREAGDQFASYASSHWDKASEADNEAERYSRESKAQRNQDWADRIAQAIRGKA